MRVLAAWPGSGRGTPGLLRALVPVLLLALALALPARAAFMARYVQQLQADADSMLYPPSLDGWEDRYSALYEMITDGHHDYVKDASQVAMGLGWLDSQPHYGVQTVVLVPWLRACAISGDCSDAVQLAVISHFVQNNVTNVESVFQLCRLWDKHGEWDLAMQTCQRGKEAMRATYGRAEIDRPMRLMHALVRYQPFRELQTAAFPPPGTPRPVFIVGVPRSGSSMLEQMLAVLPEVHAVGEQKLLDRFVLEEVQRLAREAPDFDGDFMDNWPPLFDRLEEFAASLREGFATVATPGPEATVYVEKTLTNFMYVPLLAKMLPDALFINVVRDRRDVSVSMYTILFDEIADNLAYTLSAEDIGRFLDHYEVTMDAVRRDPITEGRIVDVSYEDLVVSPERVLRRLMRFIGLRYNPDMLKFHELDNVQQTASVDQVRKPLNSKSIGRWRGYAPYMYLFGVDAATGQSTGLQTVPASPEIAP